jgi:hypothetical protein
MTKIYEIMEQVETVELYIPGTSSYHEEKAKLRAMIEDALKAPDGWKLVPVEPTDEMLDATFISQYGYINTTFKELADKHSGGIVEQIRNYLSGDYKAMLSAAPEYEG